MISVSLLYSPASGQDLIQMALCLPEGATLQDALQQAEFYQHYPEARSYMIGIFSACVSPNHRLKTGDRIEVYRPLVHDPKHARRLRARK